MITTPNTSENLRQMADLLHRNRHSVIDSWRERVSGDPQMGHIDTLTRKEFLDHVPKIIELIEGQLRGGEPSDPDQLDERTQRTMMLHGLNRWQQGFSITEVVRDWNHLRCTLVDLIAGGIAAHPEWICSSFQKAVVIIADIVAEGINCSVAKYEELRQTEARTQTLALQESIEELNQLLETQSDRYRETAHDLRGNLGVLVSVANAMKHSQSDSSSGLEEAFDTGLRYSLQLLEDLKYHSQLESGSEPLKLSQFNVSELFSRVSEAYSILAEKNGLTFETLGPDKLEVKSDQLKLSRIVQNLLNNAFKFTSKGSIRLTWGTDASDGLWSFQIQNTGDLTDKADSIPIVRKVEAAAEISPNRNSMNQIDCESDYTQSGKTSELLPSKNDNLDLRSTGEGIGISIAKRLCDLIEARLTIENLSSGGPCVLAKVVVPLSLHISNLE